MEFLTKFIVLISMILGAAFAVPVSYWFGKRRGRKDAILEANARATSKLP